MYFQRPPGYLLCPFLSSGVPVKPMNKASATVPSCPGAACRSAYGGTRPRKRKCRPSPGSRWAVCSSGCRGSCRHPFADFLFAAEFVHQRTKQPGREVAFSLYQILAATGAVNLLIYALIHFLNLFIQLGAVRNDQHPGVYIFADPRR